MPGDEIVGFVTRGRGLTIHRTDCINIMNLPDVEKNRLIEATWDSKLLHSDNTYQATLKIYVNNRKGMLVDISRVFTENNIDIASIESRTLKNDKILYYENKPLKERFPEINPGAKRKLKGTKRGIKLIKNSVK